MRYKFVFCFTLDDILVGKEAISESFTKTYFLKIPEQAPLQIYGGICCGLRRSSPPCADRLDSSNPGRINTNDVLSSIPDVIQPTLQVLLSSFSFLYTKVSTITDYLLELMAGETKCHGLFMKL